MSFSDNRTNSAQCWKIQCVELPSRAPIVPPTADHTPRPVSGDIVGQYFSPGCGRRFVLATPVAQPALWAQYLDGARQCYRSHGVESAIEYGAVRDGRSTALFVVAIDDAGRVSGGLRVQGRLTRPDQAHALREWAGRPGTAEMRAQIAQRLPFGVVEVKAVWVDPAADARLALSAALARAFVHTMDALHARFALCTAAGHAVTGWQSSGGTVAADVPWVAYPDERYRTVLMWWDRAGIAERVAPDQLPALRSEAAQLARCAPARTTESSVA